MKKDFDNFKERVKAANDIVSLIQSYGINLDEKLVKGLCPFHNEKTPSFTIYPTTQSFYCFGCHKHGDVFAFVMFKENVDFKTALSILARRAHIDIPSKKTDPDKPEPQKSIRQQIYDECYSHGRASILNGIDGREAREFLAKRGFKEDYLKSSNFIAYTPKIRKAITGKYPAEELKASGMVSYGAGFNYQVFLPHYDLEGNIIGFMSRLIVPGEMDGREFPKYRFTPNYDKSILYNSYRAIHDLKSKQECIIVEGHLDVETLKMLGFRNSLGIGGTYISEEHAKFLKDTGVKNIILWFDNDKAGMDGCEKAIRVLYKHEFSIFVIGSIDNKDANALLLAAETPDKAKQAIEVNIRNARLGIAWLAEYMGSKCNSDMDKILCVDDGMNIYCNITDSIARKEFVRALSKSLNFTMTDIEKKYKAAYEETHKDTNKPTRSAKKTDGTVVTKNGQSKVIEDNMKELSRIAFYLESIKKMIEADKSYFHILNYTREYARCHKNLKELKKITSTVIQMCSAYAADELKHFVNTQSSNYGK